MECLCDSARSWTFGFVMVLGQYNVLVLFPTAVSCSSWFEQIFTKHCHSFCGWNSLVGDQTFLLWVNNPYTSIVRFWIQMKAYVDNNSYSFLIPSNLLGRKSFFYLYCWRCIITHLQQYILLEFTINFSNVSSFRPLF